MKLGKKALKKKINRGGITSKSVLQIPSSVLQDRTISVLEALVEYLKDVQGLNYHEIGVLLNRDERNIWTVHNRAKIKRRKIGKK